MPTIHGMLPLLSVHFGHGPPTFDLHKQIGIVVYIDEETAMQARQGCHDGVIRSRLWWAYSYTFHARDPQRPHAGVVHGAQ